jgi:hypothetical protein
MGEHDAREHRGSAGILSPNSIWTEAGRRVVIDDGVELEFSPVVMAAGVLQAWATEGGGGGAGSLQGVDVVLMVLLIGAERACISGSTGGRAAAEERGSPALRPVILVEELAIGLLSELQWLVGMLFALRIGRGKQLWRLTTVSRGRGGGLVSNGDRGSENWIEKKRANAKACTRGAREGARRPEEDVPGERRRRAAEKNRGEGERGR